MKSSKAGAYLGISNANILPVQCVIIVTNRYSYNMLIRKSLAYHRLTHITMYHVLKARVAIVRHVTVVTRHPHINISCNRG